MEKDPISEREYFELKFQHLEEKQKHHHLQTQREIQKLGDQLVHLLQIERRVDQLEQRIQGNPSLIYLLRFKTRETMFWILVIFFVLSVIFISDIRQPIMQSLGLPIFIP